ncbi:hypothetical protein [Pantoea endophytica]
MMRAIYERLLNWKKQLSFVVVLSLVLPLTTWWYPRLVSDERTDDIVGRWSFDYATTQSGLTVEIKGKTTYYSTGKYNVIGNIIYKWLQDDHQNFITYRTDGAGSWKVYDKNLIISLEDMKSIPIKIKFSGKECSDAQIAMLRNFDLPSPEKTMAKGKSQSYVIKEQSGKQINLEADNPYGDNFEIIMVKDE